MQNDPGVVSAFAKLRFLVLDEADRLLDRAFEDEMRVLLSALPCSRQTLLFSATLTDSLKHLQRLSMRKAFQYMVRSSPPPSRFTRLAPPSEGRCLAGLAGRVVSTPTRAPYGACGGPLEGWLGVSCPHPPVHPMEPAAGHLRAVVPLWTPAPHDTCGVRLNIIGRLPAVSSPQWWNRVNGGPHATSPSPRHFFIIFFIYYYISLVSLVPPNKRQHRSLTH
jgi:hypothetical protein